MVGLCVDGSVQPVADALAAMDEVIYVVIAAGTYDVLCEVVSTGDEELLDLVSGRIRAVPGVRTPRRSSTSSWPSRPTRGASADRLPLALAVARHGRRRLHATPVAARPRVVRRRDRRRRADRPLDCLLPAPGRPDSAHRGARGRGGRLRRLGPQRRLVQRTVPHLVAEAG